VDGRDVHNRGTVMTMVYEVGLDATLVSEESDHADAGAVTDYIERLIDALDEAGYEGDVTITGTGPRVEISVSVIVSGDHEMAIVATGIKAISHAFDTVGTEHPFSGPTAVRPRPAADLQPA
jgi:hypothetical protein